MKRRVILALLTAGCASPPEAPPPAELPFAVAYLEAKHGVASAEESRPAEPSSKLPGKPAAKDETRGLLEVGSDRLAELRRVAADGEALAALLQQPLSRKDLEALAWLRAPAVRAAREQLEAARTGYRQSKDLGDLVALYRSFLRATNTRVGPEKSRRATGSIAPSPNVDALSAELVAKNVAIAFEQLRRAVRDIVAASERAHADAARLAGARRILKAEVHLYRSLVAVLQARLASGKSTQAALLAFQSRLESVQVEVQILGEQETAIRARWNRLLHRPAGAPLNVEVSPSLPQPDAAKVDGQAVAATALVEQQALRVAALMAERAAVAVRLAETMTLPRMDLGSSRFERERAGEAGVQRGASFPAPGRMVMPRHEFGVREAQVTEMRARLRAAQSAKDAAHDRTQAGVRDALFLLDAARRRWLVRRGDVVPLAERSFASTRGAYEGNRTGYIELLDSARRLLQARLGVIDARRDFAHARAGLLLAVGVRTAPRIDMRKTK